MTVYIHTFVYQLQISDLMCYEVIKSSGGKKTLLVVPTLHVFDIQIIN